MNGPELLKALLADSGENPYRIATRLKNPPLQSYVSKFITGKVKEPRRDSLRPVADYYGVPLEAFYDPVLADQVAVDRGLIVKQGGPRSKPLSSPPPTLARALEVLTKVLQGADESVLLAVKPLLAAMATDPATAKNKSDLILKLLVTDADKPDFSSHDELRSSHIYQRTERLTLGDENGRSDTDAATGGGKK
jgi:transcriptional regulator with XRE-family HTH domain